VQSQRKQMASRESDTDDTVDYDFDATSKVEMVTSKKRGKKRVACPLRWNRNVAKRLKSQVS